MTKNILVCFALAAALLGSAAAAPKAKPAPAPDPAGTVTRIVDGDTVWVTTSDAAAPPIVVRIEGIDAPERCQPGGAEATEALTTLALGRAVVLQVKARDDHGRLIARLLRDDGTFDVGDRLVRDGRAWSARYRFDRGPYVAQERMATALKRGVHADAAAIQPREFRRRHGPCEGAEQPPVAPAAAHPVATTPTAAAPRCDGRRHCSQMRSCAEATWFLKNCPGMQMDGNRDGVPCERQWCSAQAQR